jgi:hypothetical protein
MMIRDVFADNNRTKNKVPLLVLFGTFLNEEPVPFVRPLGLLYRQAVIKVFRYNQQLLYRYLVILSIKCNSKHITNSLSLAIYRHYKPKRQ